MLVFELVKFRSNEKKGDPPRPIRTMKDVHIELWQLVDLLNGALEWSSAERVRQQIIQDISDFKREPSRIRLLDMISKSGTPKFIQWEIRPAQREINLPSGKVKSYYEPQPSFLVEGDNCVIRARWGIDPATVSNSYPKIKRLFYSLLIRTFENGDFPRLGRCLECEKFFTANRLGQKYCDLKCTKAADKEDASDRMKRHRKKIKEQIKAEGLPKLSKLANSNLGLIRKVFGEKFEDFILHAEKIRSKQTPAKVWDGLPPWIRKKIAQAPL